MVIVPPAPVVHKVQPAVHQPLPAPMPRPHPVIAKPRRVIRKPVPKVVRHAVVRKITRRIPKPVHHHFRHRVVTKPRTVSHINRHPIKTPVAVVHHKASPLPPQPAVVTPAYRSRVRAAVQRAVKYPFAARIAQITGKVRVSFVYSHGQVSDEHVLVSSGAAVLDQAALSAVENAMIPEPPPNLRGRVLHFSIWVRFFMEHS